MDLNGLVAHGYLPAGFGQLADGSSIRWADTEAVDSLRGCPGTFLPIPDIAVQRLTHSEVLDYQKFADQYRRQWGRVDPLAVRISSGVARGDAAEVNLSIYVTPYARERYAFLARQLAPATTWHITPSADDVMGISATLRARDGQPLYVHLGLQDRAIDYTIHDGRVKLQQPLTGGTFTQSSQYVAVTPAGLEGLELVRQFVSSLQSPATTTGHSPAAPEDPLLAWTSFVLGRRAGQILKILFTASTVTTREPFTVYAYDQDLRESVVRQLGLAGNGAKTQVHMTVVDPSRTQVADYLHAFAFCESRRASSMNAWMLSQLPCQLGLPEQSGPRLAQEILGATPVCPLGGQYRLTGVETRRTWRSTAWRESSLYDVREVAAGYRFPFSGLAARRRDLV